MEFLIHYADLISAALGLVGALALAWPAVAAIGARRRWETFSQLRSRSQSDPQALADLERLRDHVEEEQLGGSRDALYWNALGLILLVFSFAFLGLAALARLNKWDV